MDITLGIMVHISSLLLLLPRKRLRSIVMSMSACVCPSVCLYVCLSVCEDISGTTRAIFTNIFVHVAYVRGSVLRHACLR